MYFNVSHHTQKAQELYTKHLYSLHRSIGIKDEGEGPNQKVTNAVCSKSGHGEEEDGEKERELHSIQDTEGNYQEHYHWRDSHIRESQSSCPQHHVLQNLSNL